jgi:hypothetical protein
MQVRTSLFAFAFSILVGCLYALPAQAATTSVTLTPASPTLTARVDRNGVPSNCFATKAFPGTIAGTFPYALSGPLTNPLDFPACYTITLTTSDTCGTEIFGTAYLGSFNPADLTANYLGDGGQSSATTSFSVVIPAHASVVIAAAYTIQNPADTCTLSVDAELYVPVPAPVLNPNIIVLLGLCLVALGGLALRRSRANSRHG